jgi:hypothetical protein
MNKDTIQKIIDLKKEYPDYEVKFLFNLFLVNDDYAFNEANIDRVEISLYVKYKDQIFTDKEEVEFALSDDCPYFIDTMEHARWFEEKYKELSMKEVILVWLE